MDRFVVRKSKSKPSETPDAKAGESSPTELDRPAKRPRLCRDASRDSFHQPTPATSDDEVVGQKRELVTSGDEYDAGAAAFSLTPLEGSAPALDTAGQEVNTECDLGRRSEAKDDADAPSEMPTSSWVPGKRSMYVDAFNLALDTVLENESHLFDGREMEVFRQWRLLGYQAQYLYVRLFLRKTASWHRIHRLGYATDISDPEAAIECLQKRVSLPDADPVAVGLPNEHVLLAEDSLGGSFTFADASEDLLADLEEAATLLNLEELKTLARETKVQGRNKLGIVKALCRMGQQQAGLLALGVRRRTSEADAAAEDEPPGPPPRLARHESNRVQHFLDQVLAVTGPCIRLTSSTYKLFERVHLVFYRSTEWTEKSLTTIILAKISRRNFPRYLVCRTSNIFPSRTHLVEYEATIRIESEVDKVLESGTPPGNEGFGRVIALFDKVYPRWKKLVDEEGVKERTAYEDGEGPYLRRFTPGHSYTRIVHKAAYALGRLKDYAREHSLLDELLGQRLFHPGRRGGWYQRRALLEEHYMHRLDPEPVSTDAEVQKRHWRRKAADTCETGLQDNDCHFMYHHDLQKRLVKLERKLRIPLRHQHSFGHVKLHDPIEHTVAGIQIKRDVPPRPGRMSAGTRTVWVDELGDGECSVEDMCLGWYRSQGWKGYHAEGGIVRTLFAYLFYEILFLPLPNVFQTAYQTCPLDLHTDVFYPSRLPEINRRLAEISNGKAEALMREVHERESERRTAVVGLDWDYEVEELAELVRGLGGPALSVICRVLAQEYRHRGGGMPDLVLWRVGSEMTATEPEAMFAEVKSKSDRLSDTQRLWIHVLTRAGVKVALCHAVAREVREASPVKFFDSRPPVS